MKRNNSTVLPLILFIVIGLTIVMNFLFPAISLNFKIVIVAAIVGAIGAGIILFSKKKRDAEDQDVRDE